MKQAKRNMALTPALVALCAREVAEPAPGGEYDYFDDKDYDQAVEKLLVEKPSGPFWLFAYCSLIWKPEFPVAQSQRAMARNWRRSFCLRIKSHRATPEQPGYMMGLDRGGTCEGVIYQISEQDLAKQLWQLLYREVGSHEALESVRWIEVEAENGPVQALTFYAHPERLNIYVGDLPLQDIAKDLARACGHWGSGAEYLYITVSHLEQLGIHDADLWRLQELVAAAIQKHHS
jgi:glutathione-specific gamma-glutamylcyclotransferase